MKRDYRAESEEERLRRRDRGGKGEEERLKRRH